MRTFTPIIIFLFSCGVIHYGLAKAGDPGAEERKVLSSETNQELEQTHWGYHGVEGPEENVKKE